VSVQEMTMQPLIGITTAEWVRPDTGWVYNRMYQPIALGVARAGGLPVYIPTGIDEPTLRAIYARLDGVLLPGGPDVDPALFGESRHPKLGEVDAPRDSIELPLVRWAVEDDLPLFGICRGHQVINVALGGTLVQDIPTQLETTINHDQPNEVPRSARVHNVAIDPDSRLAALMGATQVSVNSLHHQSVGQPAPNTCVTAYAPDGVIEALEIPDHRFALSVQWHPEDLAANDGTMQRLFDAFVAAAQK
jgi:putative glutamine amidotransferase